MVYGEGATFSDMVIRPRIRVLMGKIKVVLDQGYVLSESPCKVCFDETDDPRVRRLDWTYTCPKCGNYIVYTDLSGWLNVFGRESRVYEDIEQARKLNMHYKNRPRFLAMSNWGGSEENSS